MGRGLDGYLFIYPGLVRFSSSTEALSRKIPVAHSEWETPLPIPNRAVKPLCADGTWGATPWESRSPPVLPCCSPRHELARAACFQQPLKRLADAGAAGFEQARFLEEAAV